MPAQGIRFSVSRKIALGLLLIIAIGTLSMLFIHRGLDGVEAALRRLAEVKAPISAAAFEQELNVNGTGLAVLKYLATRRPEYREWAQTDQADFAHYHATYLQLVLSEEERELGRQLGRLHEEFATLGEQLMAQADRQERFYRDIEASTDEIDYLIDARLQPALFARSGAGGRGPALASADLEAEAAEVAMWVANYHREPTPQARDAIQSKLAVLERTHANLLAFDLEPAERRHARELGRQVRRMATDIREIVALEDSIHAGRQRFIELRMAMDEMLDERIQVLALAGLDLPRRQAEQAADDVQVAMRVMVPLYLLAAGLIGVLLVRVIRRPLAQLNRGTRAVAGGDLSFRIGAGANDEFGDLAQQYNRMVEQLQATTVSRDRLEESEGRLRETVAELRHEILERERAEQERERLQAELRRNETITAMGALVAGVAHEVRNPLFGLSSTVDAMEARFGARPDQARYLDVLRQEVDRLGKLMADLLSYGRPATREFVIGSFEAVVGRAVEESAALARERGVQVANGVQLPGDRLRLDAERLVLALKNLLDNAIQHSPDGAAVTLDARYIEQGGRRWLEFSVRDQGPGFRPEDLARVFEPFYTRRQGGTGLGLALVERIVHEHGGAIEVHKRPEGGACVTVRLPRPDG